MRIKRKHRVNLFIKEIRCKRCGRKLTNRKSVLQGYGDTCWKKRYKVVLLSNKING